MNYKKIYNHLCMRGKTERKQKDTWGRWERHHIIPRHAGGSNVASNITRLQHKEHALAHHLLYRIYHRVEDKLAYKMFYGQVSNPWKLPEFRKNMTDTVTRNLQNVDRSKQRKATSIVGKRAVEEHTGIHADGMREVAIEASKKWAKEHPVLASKRSSDSHKNRTQKDYERMAAHKSKHLILDGQGHVFHSVAEAAHFYNLKPYIIDNWVRRGSKGWSRIANTDMA
nr:MAG TPA: HNH endonuclease [Caudoviricetes sp.]